MDSEIFGLKDKLCLVTGASSGLGRETCKLLDSLGARVVAIARREDRLKSLQAECKNLTYMIYDFSRQDGIKDLINSIVKQEGRVQGFAYFAGVSSVSPLRVVDMIEAKRVFDVNFFSALECIKCLYDKRRQDSISIVLIGSASLMSSVPAMSIYDSSKGALNSLVVSLVRDLAKYGGRINSILPAHVDTEMTQKAEALRSEQYSQSIDGMYPLGRAQTTDVANLCAFLLSPLSRWITGQSIGLDGGRSVF